MSSMTEKKDRSSNTPQLSRSLLTHGKKKQKSSVAKSVLSTDYNDEYYDATTCVSYGSRGSKQTFKAKSYKTTAPFFVKKCEKDLTVPEAPCLGMMLPNEEPFELPSSKPVATEPSACDDQFNFL